MLPSDDEGFKGKYLKDVVSLSQEIRSFVGEICKTAEDAVDRMFLETPNQDVLSSTAASVLILQQCREKLAALAAAIPQLDAGRPAWPRSRRGGASNAAVAQYRTDESALCRPGVPDVNTRGSAESTPNVPALSLPKCHISPARVVFGTPYVVKLLRGGPPSKFWLRLENSCSEKIDTDLELFYSSAQPLNFIPALGSYVVCSYSQKFHRGKVVTTNVHTVSH